ncbi:MAG: aldolase/citrate lyase family protein [Candidatus Margulisiibacteriota bacterium]
MDLRRKLKRNVLSLGSWIQVPNTFIAETMAGSGFEWLAIDMEHGLIGIEDVYKLIQVIDLSNCSALVRLNENDPSTIRRVMDAGAGGIIVPMINTKKDAVKAAEALKYPPEGKRSFGLGRAHGYGRDFNGYIKRSNKDSVLVVQIEHIDAVNNLDEILSVKEIDSVIIGPYDLSGSMGIPGKFNDKRFEQTVRTIIKKVKENKKQLGIHIVNANPAELKKRIKQGFRFIGYGMDTVFLQKGIEASKGPK